jgi:hypothetical protein
MTTAPRQTAEQATAGFNRVKNDRGKVISHLGTHTLSTDSDKLNLESHHSNTWRDP